MLMLMQGLLAPMCAHKFLFDMEILVKNDNERKNHGAKGFKKGLHNYFIMNEAIHPVGLYIITEFVLPTFQS